MEQPTNKNPIYEGRHSKKAFIALYILMGALALALVGGVFYFLNQQGREAAGFAAQDDAAALKRAEQDTSLKVDATGKVVDLVSLLGQDADACVNAIGHGAYVEEDRHINESGFVRRMSVVLASERGSERAGTPTVVLYANAENKVGRAGYEATLGSVGYGAVSLEEACGEADVLGSVLNAAGLVDVDRSGIKLPAERSTYSHYATDGTTLEREYIEFNGAGRNKGKNYSWHGALDFSYDEANRTGNLIYTVRKFSISIQPA